MRTRCLHVLVGAVAALLISVGVHVVAQQRTAVTAFTDGDWPHYAGDFAGTKHSKLTQITTSNASRLVQAWTFAGVGTQQTPIAVNGIVYASAPGSVVALDGTTGAVVWRYGAAPAADGGRGAAGRGRGAGAPGAAGAEPGAAGAATGRGAAATAPNDAAAAVGENQDAPPPPLARGGGAGAAGGRGAGGARGGAAGGRGAVPTAQGPGGAPSSRGVAYWPGDGTLPPRILMMVGQRLVAVNATNGTLDTSFGTGGFIDVGVNWGGVPLVFKNIVIVGSNNGEVTIGDDPGDTKAYDARTGASLWTFVSVAQPGDPNHKGAWLDEGWKRRQGVNHWGWYFTLDEQREILYTTFGSPAGNYWGGDRPGSNLYANSVVALDVNTGKYLWHFQTVHHDLWDSDQPSPPTLLDVTVGGRRVAALGLIGKTGWMFLLDRTNGAPLFGVEERPVPKGNVPGEWYSPTQPFPVKPPALARVDFKKEDLVTAADTTPEHAKNCLALYERAGGLYNAGPFTPFQFHEEGAPPNSTIQFPGNGGTNWGGPAGDPSLGYIFAFTQDAAFTGWIEKKRDGGNYGSGNGSPQPYDRGSITGPGPYSGFAASMGEGLPQGPCQRPPWGRLTAVNAATGEFAWQIPLGITDGLSPEKQNTGRGGAAGPMTTASGLLFIGTTADARFRAIDSKSGKELFVTRLNATGAATPMTYQGRNGKQYVVQAAAGTLNVFALP
jgi:quinoprotein glucose dehydrogenase